jgi:hypothetical protein
MPLPHNFYTVALTTLNQIDENFAAIGNLATITTTVATGSTANNLLLMPGKFTPQLEVLVNYQQFSGIATTANTGPVTATVVNGIMPSIPPFPVYKDTPAGPVPLTGGEIVPNSPFTLMFDQSLNGGAGGFHLGASAAQISGSFLPVTGGTLTGPLVGPAATFTQASISTLTAPTAAFNVASVTTALTAGSGTFTGPVLAPSATITSITATTAVETTASIGTASIGTAAITTTLTAPAASITALTAASAIETTATVTTASIATASIGTTLTAPSASITTLTATNASISVGAFTTGVSAPTATFTTASIGTASIATTLTAPAASITTVVATNETVANSSIATAHVTSTLTAPSASITALTGPITGTQATFTQASIATISPTVASPFATGTFTPSDASGAGLVFTSPVGWWTQMGNMVFFRGQCIYPATASASLAAISIFPTAVPPPPINASCPSLVVASGSTQGIGMFVFSGTTVTAATLFNTTSGQRLTNAQVSGLNVQFDLAYQWQ